ncbi:LOW QUALITY PROTEIN: 15-hydroxyprostaglandin dehydrogenase [NAD(+)]-like [Pristis pectinata]|uniref:LOW QUALITY PROTEIN: 15-hydroxyprostaglandin dehydrogenase [NAD(+)]-like n=1 Tax=Pristis pectinata TaxID=685728 RepID=UPI00223D6250|nr:LOW QUALITY PROTEIN: 15-hydroxyprostaglandin dehydrogenase [NAD(+)]-like [Pristis pectinata]
MALSDKVALVTGAAQGIGKAFSAALLRQGCKVVILDMNAVAGEACKNDLDTEFDSANSLFIACDVGSEEQLKCAFKKQLNHFGSLDILCNNAGINNENNWEQTINVNLTSVIRGTYLALDYMSKQNGGKGGIIVNIASLAGIYPAPHGPVYTATKHGVVGFSRAIAATSKLAGYGVRINTICPAFVDTPLLSSVNSKEMMGNYYIFKDTVQKLIDFYGILDPSLIVQGLMKIIQEEDLNGAVMRITKTKGIHFETYESALIQPELK